MDVDEDEVPEHRADGMGAALSAADVSLNRDAVRDAMPAFFDVASTCAIALYVYYPIALHHFYLIVSREDMVRPA
jgi:hypothetical protein